MRIHTKLKMMMTIESKIRIKKGIVMVRVVSLLSIYSQMRASRKKLRRLVMT